MGISWFWFIGITYVTQLPNFVRYELGGDEQVYVLLLAMFSVGIGAGSFVMRKNVGAHGRDRAGADRLARPDHVRYRPLFQPGPGGGATNCIGPAQFMARARACASVSTSSCSAFSAACISCRCMRWCNNAATSSNARASSPPTTYSMRCSWWRRRLYGLFALSAGVSIPVLFLIMALMNAAVALFIFMLVPEFIMRLLVWLLVHTIYRVDKSRPRADPGRGSRGTGLQSRQLCRCAGDGGWRITAPDPVRHVSQDISPYPVLSFVFKTANAIPIAGARGRGGNDGTRVRCKSAPRCATVSWFASFPRAS